MDADNIRDFSWYSGNVAWLKDNTIFLAKHGSRAYGTDLPGSDLDIRGVAIPPKDLYLSAWQGFDHDAMLP